MTDYAEHLEKELLAARSELAELRKRVCVPEGYVVVPVKPSAGHLDSMAMRMRHDFGLLPEYLKERFRGDARQTYEECTGQGFYKLPAAPAPVERVEQDAKVFWVLFDNTGDVKYIKKDVYSGTLAFFDNEADASLAKQITPDTDYMRVEYYTTPQPAPTAAQDVGQLLNDLLEFFEGSGINPGNDIALRLASALTNPQPAAPASASAVPVEQVEQEAVSYYERAHGKKSPTYGMSLDERIEHVEGRTNAAGYIEFDSDMAVSALIDHVLRDSPAPRSALTADPWKASGVEYDPAIHHNPDAKAWADLFVQTFPAQADQHELMLGWFSNAMMAMHDWLKTKESPAPTAAQDGWVSVAERMPPAGTKVLAFYRNSMGVSRRICAEYIGKHQRDAFDFDQDCEADYDEATDQYYWPEGWYERVDNWDELTHLAVTEGEITHWRVMPAVPGLDAHQSGGAKA